MRLRLVGAAVTAVLSSSMIAVSPVSAATPGWECVPATAGRPVVSGGTGATPVVTSGRGTAYSPPPTSATDPAASPPCSSPPSTSRSSAASGPPTPPPTATGNLIIGYDEGTGAKTGSHNLILGRNQAYASYASIIAGSNNTDNAAEAALLATRTPPTRRWPASSAGA